MQTAGWRHFFRGTQMIFGGFSTKYFCGLRLRGFVLVWVMVRVSDWVGVSMVLALHSCQLSVIRTESPSFSSRQNLRPRKRKSPSFEHRHFFWDKKQRWHLDEVGHHVQEMQEKRKRRYKAHFNPDWVKEWPALIAKSHKSLCRCDFSVSSGESKTYSVTSLIVTRCHH